MATEMPDKDFEKIPNVMNLIFYSGQGWQYRYKQSQRMPSQRISRKGNCLDNAATENFFGLLKSELLHLQTFESMERFKREFVDYLDH